MVLLVAFKGKHNTSYQLVSLFEENKLFLTNSFQGIDKDIENADVEKYYHIIMFGLDKNLMEEIRIERIAKWDGSIKETNIDVDKIKEVFNANDIKCKVSEKSSKYLCNYAYYKMLEKANNNTIFIHIPGLKNMKNEFMVKIKNVVDKLIK